MNIIFDALWDQPDNNINVYGKDREGKDKPACGKREIYVMVCKLTTKSIWCDTRQLVTVRDFIKGDLLDQTVCVMKGVHYDRFRYDYGPHITLKVVTGCRSGNTFHAYGEKKEYAWEPDFVMEYHPKIVYKPDHKVAHAVPENRIAVSEGLMPAGTPGSEARNGW